MSRRGATAIPATAVPPAWTGDPAVWEAVEESLSTLTVKRRRFLKNFLATGHIANSVHAAGYNVKDNGSANDVGREILRDPKVQFCTQAIFEAEGIGSAAKLKAVLGHHLAGYDSVDGGDRDRSLRAASLVYKHGRPRPSADAKPLPEALLDEMTEAELRRFVERQEWPAWAAERLRRAGFSLRRNGAAQASAATPDDDRAGDKDGAASDPTGDPTASEVAPPARPARAPESDPTPPPPLAAHAPATSAQVTDLHSWQRPEDRVFASARPAPEPPAPQPSSGPAADASALDATDPIAEAKRAAVLHALATRDRCW